MRNVYFIDADLMTSALQRLAFRISRATLRMLVLRCFTIWRWSTNQNVRQPRPDVAIEKPVTQPAVRVPVLPTRVNRKDLYKMSYEALIDKVLELQEFARATVTQGSA